MYIYLQSVRLKCFSWFFCSYISVISRDSAHWLRAQDAAASLCCRPWQRLGVGQRWHGQRDAGEVCVPLHPPSAPPPPAHTVITLRGRSCSCAATGVQACVNGSVTSAASVIVQGLTLDSRLAPVLVTVRLALNTFYEWTESRIFKIAARF